MSKRGTSFRLSVEARNLIEELSKKLGVSQASIIEMAVRMLAEREKVQ